MQVRTTTLPGVLLFVPQPHRDERGMFSRTFDREIIAGAGIDPDGFSQDSLSRSHRGVIRGMHLRTGQGEAKLVRCSAGGIFDVVLDLRPDSPSHLRWESFELTGENQISIYIPAGCAHGHQTLTEPGDTCYRIDRPHDPSEDLIFAYDDPQFAIPWPLPPTIMSAKDRAARPLAEVLSG